MKASARSVHQKHDLTMQVQDKKSQSQTSPLKNKSLEGSSHELKPSVTALVPIGCDVTPISSVPMEVDTNESRKRQGPDSGFQATVSIHKENSPTIAAGRSLEDIYNWRKYGEKHVKGNESTRSYYKCSHPNCDAKKQVIRSYEGQTREITYKGNHDHPAPLASSEMAVDTALFIYKGQAKEITYKAKHDLPKPQLSSDVAVDNTSESHDQIHNKPNGTPDPSPITARNNEGAGAKSEKTEDKRIVGCYDPKSSKKCHEFNIESGNNTSAKLNHKRSIQSIEVQGECESPALESPSGKIQTATVSSNEQTTSLTVQNSPPQVVTSRAIVPVEVDAHELQQRQVLDSIVQAMPSDLKGPLMAAERLSEDGYNWRKYGQKRISGSEFPRSYYRCTHPNCQVKKQLERSHDGKVREIIYKGSHDHPKPLASSRMVVGTILSIQEESDRVSLNIKKEKSSNGHGTASCDTNPKSSQELALVVASDGGVEGQGQKSIELGKEVNKDENPEPKSRCLESNNETSNALAESNQQSEPSLQIQVYMVASKDGLPMDVDSDEKREREGSDGGLQASQSYQKGTSSLIPTERLPDDVYNWRKYGQKHIKGNEFPRSYYRCTYPNCQVKKQLGLSHDGRIIEIIFKGKHDHPKPLPRGAVLSIQEERSDRFSPLDSTNGKPSNEDGHSQTSHYIKIIGANELPTAVTSDDDLESPSAQSNRVSDDVEGDDDPQTKRRKKDVDDLDVTAMGRTTREPRLVVEKPSEVDVVDDGYRWHKYGRKMVKGNANPRNYYRCSNSGCSVKKHVERASHNPKLLITTYEGNHNHDMPAPRTYINDTAAPIVQSAAVDGAAPKPGSESEENEAAPKPGSEENDAAPKPGSEENDADNLDNDGRVGATVSNPDNIMNMEQRIPDSEAGQDQNKTQVDMTPHATCHGDGNGDGSKDKQNEIPSFDNPPP